MQQEYLDMHDGDEKTVSLRGSTMEIHPLGNGQKWMVRVHARGTRPSSPTWQWEAPRPWRLRGRMCNCSHVSRRTTKLRPARTGFGNRPGLGADRRRTRRR